MNVTNFKERHETLAFIIRSNPATGNVSGKIIFSIWNMLKIKYY